MKMKLIYALVFSLAPVVATAELTYPIDISVWEGRTAYLDTDTGQITDRNRSWPATDPDLYTCPVCGVNPGWPSNIAPLLQADPDPIPSYDSRLYSLSSSEVVCGPTTPLPTECEGVTDQLKKVWNVTKRPTEEQVLASANEASFQITEHIPENKLWLYALIQIGLNAYRLDSQSLPPKWQTFNDKNLNYIQTKILPIYDRYIELKQDVEADIEPDMDTGWPVPVPGDLPE